MEVRLEPWPSDYLTLKLTFLFAVSFLTKFKKERKKDKLKRRTAMKNVTITEKG